MRNKLPSFISIFLILCVLVSCNIGWEAESVAGSVTIKDYTRVELVIGETLQLEVEEVGIKVVWSASNDAVSVDQSGLVTALREGKVAVSASSGTKVDSIMIEVISAPTIKPDTGFDDENYGLAESYLEALERSSKGLLSGSTTVPDQAPVISSYRPSKNGQFVRNTASNFIDDNTYAVVDAYGNEVFRVYRGGGYITIEEVAAYVYAFGDVPANYVSSKKKQPEDSIWGEYLRLNHTRFSGDTEKYPYEPVLPNISGCGGDLYYYEIDIGTTGTDCDPGHDVKIYNDGETITRGAARIVYGKYDLDHDGVYEFGEHHVFYTYNHYNDFQEYLNYYGGWGEMFGNITGGGSISSKYDYSPTEYVAVIWEELPSRITVATVYFYDPRRYMSFAA